MHGTTGLGLACRGLPTNHADAALTEMVSDDLPGFVIELESLYIYRGQQSQQLNWIRGHCNDVTVKRSLYHFGL